VRRLAGLASGVALAAGLALGLAALSNLRSAHSEPVPHGAAIEIVARPVALDPRDPARRAFGRFTYAGGLELSSAQTSRLHGVSDLKVWPDGRLLAVTDGGDLMEARLQLDAAGRLVGLTDLRLTPLPDSEGQPANARGKAAADAEGVAEFAYGDRLVSFEVDDRIVFYGKAGVVRRVPAPGVRFSQNFGMEALAADPALGEDGYRVGAELAARLWDCRLSSGCVERPRLVKSPTWGLVAIAPLGDGRTAYLLRALDIWFGRRARIQIHDASGKVIDELAIGRDLQPENYEGLAAVSLPDGPTRFYLVSDDDYADGRRTLLLAFDWSAP
jgi:hypothetical protein